MEPAKKVLIIDDDPDFTRGIQAILEHHSYEVVTAPDGHTGYQKAQAEKPDVIMVDIMMETWDQGFSLVNQFREDAALKQTPLLMVSAMDLRGQEMPYPGASWLSERFILTKPVTEAELLKAIERALKTAPTA